MQSPSVEERRSLLESFLDGTLLLRPPERPLVGALSAGHSAPLSCWQLHVWNYTQLAARLSPGAQLFNETITIHRRGPLEVPALEKSFNEILRRHQAWRTTFRVVDGQPQQIVNPPAVIPLLVFDLRHLLEAEQEREVLRLGTEDVRTPFDLQNGPLVRARLLRLSDLEWKLLLTVHQILLDGVSVYNVFLPELMSLYKSFSTGQSSPLPELRVQYPDYAVWERERSQSDVLSGPVAYWRTQLHGPLPQLDLPTDGPRPAQQTFHGAILPFALPRQLSEQVRLYSQRENVTLFIALLAVFYGLLHGYTGQEDIVVGTIAPTRQRSELQALLGYFLNPVVLRADLSGDPTFRELLNRSRNLFLEAISYSEAPFDSLVEMLEPQPTLDRHPLYQIQISLEPPLPALDEGWNLTPMDFESGGAKLDLYMVFDDRPSGIIGRVQYNPDLFSVSTMSRLVEHYQALLEAVVANPLQRLSELPRFKLTESCMNASIPGASGR
jgi:surfactin family lipopeptide synthetase A